MSLEQPDFALFGSIPDETYAIPDDIASHGEVVDPAAPVHGITPESATVNGQDPCLYNNDMEKTERAFKCSSSFLYEDKNQEDLSKLESFTPRHLSSLAAVSPEEVVARLGLELDYESDDNDKISFASAVQLSRMIDNIAAEFTDDLASETDDFSQDTIPNAAATSVSTN